MALRTQGCTLGYRIWPPWGFHPSLETGDPIMSFRVIRNTRGAAWNGSGMCRLLSAPTVRHAIAQGNALVMAPNTFPSPEGA